MARSFWLQPRSASVEGRLVRVVAGEVQHGAAQSGRAGREAHGEGPDAAPSIARSYLLLRRAEEHRLHWRHHERERVLRIRVEDVASRSAQVIRLLQGACAGPFQVDLVAEARDFDERRRSLQDHVFHAQGRRLSLGFTAPPWLPTVHP